MTAPTEKNLNPICVYCKEEIPSPRSFRNNISLREFFISGLCQKCQDEVFKEDEP